MPGWRYLENICTECGFSACICGKRKYEDVEAELFGEFSLDDQLKALDKQLEILEKRDGDSKNM